MWRILKTVTCFVSTKSPCGGQLLQIFQRKHLLWWESVKDAKYEYFKYKLKCYISNVDFEFIAHVNGTARFYKATTLLRYTFILYYAKAWLRYSFSTALQLYYTTALLRYIFISLQLYHATFLLRYSCTALQLCYATAWLRYSFTTLHDYYATALLRYSSAKLLLLYAKAVA